MIATEALIVGGGPAGAACAGRLRQNGMDCLVLDAQTFPRVKPCAGWVTPEVFRALHMTPADYPHGINFFNRFYVSIRGVRFTLPTRQYAIRRVEFDDWLLRRSGAPVETHRVHNFTREGERYVIDDAYTCRYLVGAGGTHCPVARTFFPPREPGKLIVAQEEEFAYPNADPHCRLWFFEDHLPGYAWYVPKAGGFVNVGVGGNAKQLKARGDNLKRHWNRLVDMLDQQGWVRGHEYKPLGHSYYLRSRRQTVQQGNVYLVGDAAGLATLDMGEGIRAAVESGLRAADAILFHTPYTVAGIARVSLGSILGPIE